MPEGSYFAVCCDEDDCMKTVKVGSLDEAVEKAAQGCSFCYGHAFPFRFDPMPGQDYRQGSLLVGGG